MSYELTRAPTSDEAVSGDWTGTVGSRYRSVDDYPDTATADYLEHGTTAGNITFGFSAISIPSWSTNIEVHADWYDAEPVPGTNSVAGRLKVDGTYYNDATPDNPSAFYTERTATWATNPDTAAAWTPSELNGLVSTLEAFGVVSSDADPVFRIRAIQLRVTYDVIQAVRVGVATMTMASLGATSRVPAQVGVAGMTMAAVGCTARSVTPSAGACVVAVSVVNQSGSVATEVTRL